ncbi:MAG: CpaD family pilus assembly protein [Asticcacaulis sp.]
MTAAPFSPRFLTGVCVLALASALGACQTMPSGHAEAAKPDPVLPTTQYALAADSHVKTLNFRVNSKGLSDNQRRALDQVASRAAWTRGDAVDVEIITSGEPSAVAAGHGMAAYLSDHDVSDDSIDVHSAPEQAPDIVTVNLVYYRAKTYDCNRTWENLTSTGANKTYKNFGCAITSNLAAQIADPRDLDHPRAADSSDAGRKSVVLDKYRKGQITASESDVNAKGNISDAVK